MSLQCQKDSYLRQFTSTVISCQPAKLNKLDCYEVTLNDTILFPGGGGQPSDRGQISGIEVFDVERRAGGVAVHYLKEPIQIGQEVQVIVDWSRRHDHMQQHSGQHLITAIADLLYGYKTVSWNLAVGHDNKCSIELSTLRVSTEEMQAIEDRCNECIRDRIPMTPRWLDPDSKELEEIRTRGLPDDVIGKVRVVDIVGVDSNMCCGTHVNNLSDIQAIKLLYTEPKRGGTLLYYVAGNRVFHYMGKSVEREKKLTKLLCVGTDEQCDAVDRILKAQRSQTKVIRNQLRELAQLIAFRHLNTEPVDRLAVIHRDDGDNEFMNIVASELCNHGILVFISVGGDNGKGTGQFLLAGDETIINEVGSQVTELLQGKAGGRKGRLQGKASYLQGCSQVETLLREKLTALS